MNPEALWYDREPSGVDIAILEKEDLIKEHMKAQYLNKYDES